MPRTWRSRVAQLLALYLILDVIAVMCAAVAHLARAHSTEASWLPVAVFLTWRVSRGGRVARVILIIVSVLSFAAAMHISSSSWSPSVLVLLAIYATQIAVLVSPAVYQRTGPKLSPTRASSHRCNSCLRYGCSCQPCWRGWSSRSCSSAAWALRRYRAAAQPE